MLGAPTLPYWRGESATSAKKRNPAVHEFPFWEEQPDHTQTPAFAYWPRLRVEAVESRRIGFVHRAGQLMCCKRCSLVRL